MGTNARQSGPWVQAMAATIRAQAALRDWPITELASRANMSVVTLRKSLKYGRPIDIEELGMVAVGLGMTVSDLVAEAERVYLRMLDEKGTPMGESLRAPLTVLRRKEEEPPRE